MILSNVALKNAITFGEDKKVRYVVRDRYGNYVNNFDGWEVIWFLLNNQSINGDITVLTEEALLVKSSSDSDEIDLSNPPYITVSIDNTDIIDMSVFHPRNYAHELWRKDQDNVRRLSYGRFPIVN